MNDELFNYHLKSDMEDLVDKVRDRYDYTIEEALNAIALAIEWEVIDDALFNYIDEL